MDHKYEVKYEMDHLVLYVDGKLYCRCDNYTEVNEEIQEIESKENN